MSESKFVLPAFLDHPTGWGPVGGVDKFEAIPFSSFSKGERLGKISDWTYLTSKPAQSRPNQSAALGTIAPVGGANTNTNPLANIARPEDEDNTFSVVDTKGKKMNKFRKFRPQTNTRQQQQQRRQVVASATQKATPAKPGTRGAPQQEKKVAPQPKKKVMLNVPVQEIKDIALKVEENWEKLAEFEWPKLKSVQADVKAPEDLLEAGFTYEYKKVVEQINPNNASKLRSHDRHFFTVTTSDDPILQRFVKEEKGQVFATDTIICALMTSYRSVYPWDISVRKEGDKIFLDKRPESRLDYFTVNENFSESTDRDSMNHPFNLSTEATFINHNFSQEVLAGDRSKKLEHPEPNPFLESLDKSAEAAAVGYRYRSWKLKDDTNVVVRCEYNTHAAGKDGKLSLLSAKALNEYDPKASGGVGWKRTLGTQPAAVFATEIKTNNNKLSRWTAQAMLCGVDQIKIGFVSRINSRDPQHHELLKVIPYSTSKLAGELKLTTSNMWGVVQFVIDEIRKLPDGKYVLLKDKEPKLKLYRPPDSA